MKLFVSPLLVYNDALKYLHTDMYIFEHFLSSLNLQNKKKSTLQKLALLPSPSETTQPSQLDPLETASLNWPNWLGCMLSPDDASKASYQNAACLKVLKLFKWTDKENVHKYVSVSWYRWSWTLIQRVMSSTGDNYLYAGFSAHMLKSSPLLKTKLWECEVYKAAHSSSQSTLSCCFRFLW